MVNYLDLAELYFEKDKCQWGLGLTYNLFGRLQSLCHSNDWLHKNSDAIFQQSKDYLKRAIKCFSKIDHFKGIYTSARELHFIHQAYLYEPNIDQNKRA